MTRPSTSKYQAVSAGRTRGRRLCTAPLVAQPIAVAAQRLDERRRARLVELAPQIADIDVDDVAFAVELPAPHPLGDLRAAQGLAGMAQQILEDGELSWCQRDRLGAVRH